MIDTIRFLMTMALVFLIQWSVRWAVRSELERMGFRPLKPRPMTDAEWIHYSALLDAGKHHQAEAYAKKTCRAYRA